MLKPHDPDLLDRLALAVSTPGAADYHRFLTEAQFVARFGAPQGEIVSIDRQLRALDLQPGPVAANHLSIPVTSSARVIERALETPLVTIELGRRTVQANTAAPRLPAALASDLVGVIGLDSLPVATPGALPESPGLGAPPHALSPHGAPSPTAGCTAAIQAAYGNAGAGFSADQIATAYQMNGLYQTGDSGAPTSVAVIEFSPFSSSDLSTYAACYGVNPSIETVPVDGGPGAADPPSEVEAELDIEELMSLAPGASLIVYEGPNNAGGVSSKANYDTFEAAINSDVAKVITTSWGSCEPSVGESTARAENQLFEQAALQGQTVVAAAGDGGAEDCYDTTSGSSAQEPAVDDPASQPFVTGVGGTTLTLSPARSEVVWNTGPRNANPGAGGGGLSAFWSMPAYQRGAAATLNVVAPDVDRRELRRNRPALSRGPRPLPRRRRPLRDLLHRELHLLLALGLDGPRRDERLGAGLRGDRRPRRRAAELQPRSPRLHQSLSLLTLRQRLRGELRRHHERRQRPHGDERGALRGRRRLRPRERTREPDRRQWHRRGARRAALLGELERFGRRPAGSRSSRASPHAHSAVPAAAPTSCSTERTSSGCSPSASAGSPRPSAPSRPTRARRGHPARPRLSEPGRRPHHRDHPGRHGRPTPATSSPI